MACPIRERWEILAKLDCQNVGIEVWEGAAWSDCLRTIAELPPDVLRTPDEIAVLAGAGISLAAPACLLAGAAFQEAILDRLVPDDIDRQALRAALTPSRFVRPGEGLRFEQLMGTLVDSWLDRDLTVLDCLDECESPNHVHYLLAALVRAGTKVITTNFDRLIELACRHSWPAGAPPLRVAAFDADFAESGRAGPVLWKLHGSLSIGGESTRESIQATLPAVLARGMSRRKREFLEATLAERDLLVIGYSGWDDFDIVPALAAIGARRMVWVDHRGDVEPPRVLDAEEIAAEHHASSDLDVVAFRRLLFSSSSERLLVIRGATDKVLEGLATRWDLANVAVHSHPMFQFDGDAYFDAWAAKLGPPARRYDVLGSLVAQRAYRPEAAAVHGVLDERVRLERALWDSEPHERLLSLVSAYNAGHPAHGVRQALRLLRGLEPQDECLALRLDAYLTWQLDGRTAGVAAFGHACDVARAHGDVTSEFVTMYGWLLRDEHATEVPLWWADGEEAKVNEMAAHFLPPDAPDLERLTQLVAMTGRQIDLWRTALTLREGESEMGDNYMIFIEAISGELDDDDWQHELSTMRAVRRHSVDVGDVVGEARASLVLGGMQLCLNRPRPALADYFRVLELSRITDLGLTSGWARIHAKHSTECLLPGRDHASLSMAPAPYPGRYDDARRIRTAVQRSMWGTSDLPPAPADTE